MTLYRGRCPHCFKITPVPKDKWHKAVTCQWCQRKFVPFATKQEEVGPQVVYDKHKVSKSIEAFRNRTFGRKVA